jgi:hypothetical protein
MNKTAAIIGGAVVIVLIGGLIYYTVNNNTSSAPAPATSTTVNTTTDNTGQTTTPVAAAQPSAPAVATNGSVFPFNTTAVVSGTVVPNGSFTSYWFTYGATAQMTSRTATQLVGSGYTAIITPAYIAGLATDTTYYFSLVAQNQYGTVSGAQYTFQTTHNATPPVGSMPTLQSLAANGISRTAANLNGAVTPNQSSTQYWFEYGTTQNLGQITSFASVGSGTAKVSAASSLSNLTPATTYYFRLDAQNEFGTVNGAILHFTTAGPPVSVQPVVTTQVATEATTTATLRGTVNPYSTQTTYWFEYSTDSTFATALKTTPQKSAGAGAATVSVQANITGLRALTTYYYRTVAQNTAGIVRGDSMSFQTL